VIDLAGALASVVLLCCSMVARPAAARCGPGFYVNGICPTGVFECRRVPGGDPLYDGAGGFPDRSIDRPGWYRSRVYCTGGAHPIVVLGDREARTVGCQR
jgi:hypothetical protein